jgi:hypothetical protein
MIMDGEIIKHMKEKGERQVLKEKSSDEKQKQNIHIELAKKSFSAYKLGLIVLNVENLKIQKRENWKSRMWFV